MELGLRISQARKNSKLTLEQLGQQVGIKKSALSVLENGKKKGQPDPELIVKISAALGDSSILTTYLKNNPAYQAVLPNISTELCRSHYEPAKIFSDIAKKMAEGANAAKTLSQLFTNSEEISSLQETEQLLTNNLKQLLDVKQCVDTLEFELIANHIPSTDPHTYNDALKNRIKPIILDT